MKYLLINKNKIILIIFITIKIVYLSESLTENDQESSLNINDLVNNTLTSSPLLKSTNSLKPKRIRKKIKLKKQKFKQNSLYNPNFYNDNHDDDDDNDEIDQNFYNNKFITLNDLLDYDFYMLKNQSKIIIQLEKLTSKSVLIKWNNVSFLNKNQPYFKLEYYLKTNPDKVITHDKLTNTELQLINLKPNSDYLVQIVAISPSDSASSQVITSELAVKHFRTLITDLEPPTNLQVIRFEADKINIRWDPVEIIKPDYANDKKHYNLIKGYRIYYKEYQSSNSAYNYDYSSDDLDIGSSEEWKMIEKYGDKNTEANLENLNINRDYAIKIVAIDNSNNEGPESQIQIAYKLMQDGELSQSDLNSQSQQSIVDYSSISNQVTDKIGQPRDLEIIEYTSSSVKFSWMPPEPTQSYKIRDFFISYVDRAKYYRETNGSIVSYVKGIVMTIKAPARDDPTIKITWLVTGLSPYTDYDFNISAVSANDLQGLPVYKQIRTKPGRPLKVDAPQVLDIYTDNTVLIKTGNASERNGPILKYWLVVVPLGYESLLKHQKSDASSEDILKAQNNDAREKDVSNLLKYSIFNQSLLSNESAYIAAEFISEYWPSRFILGDGSIHGRFLNRKLIRGYDYKAYIIAFTDEQAGSSLNKQHRPNMVGLGDILNSKPKQIYADGDLFTYSAYSEKFNTKNLETTSNQIQSFSGLISMTDYHNILWVIGAIAGFILIFILIIIVSVNLMQKNKANKQKNQNIITNAGSATSSTTTTTNFLNSIKNQPVDTQIIMNKIGNYTTNTIKKNSHDMANVQGIISSSSSSSSTTVSPTTALLSCSVNNTSSNNVGSQSSASNNLLLNSNGLLTTASPLRPQPQTESLYTSIEVTQKLLQQQFMNAPSESSTMMMMMNSTTNTFNTGTINRNNALGIINHYDPIEYRRIHHPTQALLSHPPILIDELFQQLEKLKHQNNLKFSQEYESIEPGQQFTWENSTLEINRQKNRYANVISYDHSRVILSKLPPSSFSNLSNTNNSQINSSLMSSSISNGMLPSPPLPPPPPPPPGLLNDASPADLSNCSDYINANYMDGYRKRNCYIATQGPLPSTYGDFWRMIWEQQTCTIVMMTKLEERSRLKCDQYWPSKGTEIFDNSMQVTLVDLTELSTYTIRTFVISPVNTYAQIQITNNSNNINYEMRREIKHFQFTAWPDHGVPDHPTQFLMFLRRVKNSNPSDSGPIVVHCSAGVGRTGCYIVIDTMLDRIKNEKSIDIYGHVTCLRAQRNYMVQTEDQYIFCYDSVLEASQTGQTEIPARNLYHHLQRLLQISSEDPNLMLTEMELEYKRLSNIKAPQSKFQSANLPANKFKNRLVNILPYEATRVCLQQLPNAPEASGTDYINANFIDGYKYKKAYIATQAPLTETIDDFWRMLWEHNSTIVVMLTKLREMGREKCAQYWPTDRSIRYQYFVVDPIAEYNMTQYILREFKVTDARDGQSRTIRQFQFVDWPEQGVPKSGESIIELIGQVHKTKEQFGQIGPITVHCSAGVGRTGVFITLSIVLERMRFEGVIDVFNTVKVLRTQRPAMVQTEDQYQFCYKSALEYLGTFESYE